MIRTYGSYYSSMFTPCSSVSIVNFEHVIIGWEKRQINLSKFTIITASVTHSDRQTIQQYSIDFLKVF